MKVGDYVYPASYRRWKQMGFRRGTVKLIDPLFVHVLWDNCVPRRELRSDIRLSGPKPPRRKQQ